MKVRQLDNDPPFGVVTEGDKERGGLGHVVNDMAAHDHRRRRGLVGDLGPAAGDLPVRHPQPLGRLGEDIKHGLALVDGDQHARRRRQAEAVGAATGADIEHYPTRRQCFQGPPPRRAGLGVGQCQLGRQGEQPRRETPGRLGCGRHYPLGDGP